MTTSGRTDTYAFRISHAQKSLNTWTHRRHVGGPTDTPTCRRHQNMCNKHTHTKMDQYVSMLLQREFNEEIIETARKVELFPLLQAKWKKEWKSCFFRLKKYSSLERTRIYDFKGYFYAKNTLNSKYYVNVSIKATMDRALEGYAEITCFTITSIHIVNRKKEGLVFLLLQLQLMFDDFNILVDYMKIEGVMDKSLLNVLLQLGFRRRYEENKFDTTLYKKV